MSLVLMSSDKLLGKKIALKPVIPVFIPNISKYIFPVSQPFL